MAVWRWGRECRRRAQVRVAVQVRVAAASAHLERGQRRRGGAGVRRAQLLARPRGHRNSGVLVATGVQQAPQVGRLAEADKLVEELLRARGRGVARL